MNRSKQRGIATVLILLLTGLGLAAMAFAAISHVGELQQRSITLHAATQAEAQAWTAEEALRQYFLALGTDVTKLKPSEKVAFNGSLAAASVDIAGVRNPDADTCGGSVRLDAVIHGAAGPATSTIGVVYCIEAASADSGSDPTLPSGNNIRGPLVISGGQEFKGNGKSKFFVDGGITGSGSITGYDSVYANGDVSLSGFSDIKTLAASGNLDVEGTFGTLQSMKSIKLRGGATKATTIQANGDVVDTNGGTYGSIEAGHDVTLTDGTHVAVVHAQGSVSGRSSVVSSELLAQDSFTETGCCSQVANGAVGNAVNLIANRNPSAVVNLNATKGLKVSVAAVSPQKIDSPRVDAFSLKGAANYVFGTDSQGHLTATTHAAGDVPDGQYFIAGSGGHQDYLCKTSTYADASCLAKICTGFSDYNSCFSYSNGQWSLNGPKDKVILPPGTVWFTGNVNVGSGHYMNTILATGNVSTSSDTFVTAPNYAGYGAVCKSTQFPTLAPRDICAASALNSTALGDVALLAGSYVGDQFQGGKISLGAFNDIVGNVVAGDVIQTAGNTTIEGLVNAAYQGRTSGDNTLGAKTTIDQTKVHLPDDPPASSSGAGGGAGSVKVLWTRYL